MQPDQQKLNFSSYYHDMQDSKKAEEIAKKVSEETEIIPEIIGVEPVTIKTNLENIKQYLIKQRDNFVISVDEESTTKARSEKAKLNKLAKTIKDRVEDALRPITDPITEISLDVKEISSICKEIVLKIDTGIAKAELQIRENITKFAGQYLTLQYEKNEILKEFQNININKFENSLSNINAKNTDITPSCKSEIDNLVLSIKNLQTMVNIRLLMLENACLKAEICTLERSDVQNFLMENEEIYNQKLTQLIEKTKAREDRIKAEAIAKERYENEKKIQEIQTKIDVEKAIIKGEIEAKTETKLSEIKEENEAKTNLNETLKFGIIFEINGLKATQTKDEILQAFKEKLAKFAILEVIEKEFKSFKEIGVIG